MMMKSKVETVEKVEKVQIVMAAMVKVEEKSRR
jgi:hypothetical protein